MSSKIKCTILYIFIFYDSLQTVDKSIGAIYMVLHKNDFIINYIGIEMPETMNQAEVLVCKSWDEMKWRWRGYEHKYKPVDSWH